MSVFYYVSAVGNGGGHTVVVLFLEVHVDNTTRPDIVHLLAVERFDLRELTGLDSVAAVLSKEDGDGVVLELLSTGLEARLLVVGVTAPRVDVVTPEVNAVIGVVAVEVVGHLLTDVSIVVGGVTNTHRAVVLGLDVLLHVTDSGLDEGTGVGVVGLVGDFITSKETNDVGVLRHLVNNADVAAVEIGIPLGVVADDGLARRGQIRDNVDTGILEQLHTLAVVGLGVDGVGTDGVGTQLLKVGDITLASIGVGQGVLEVVSVGLGARILLLISNTLYVELGVVALVEELGTLDDNRVQVSQNGTGKESRASDNVGKLHDGRTSSKKERQV